MTRFCTQWRNKHWARTANFHVIFIIIKIPHIHWGFVTDCEWDQTRLWFWVITLHRSVPCTTQQLKNNFHKRTRTTATFFELCMPKSANGSFSHWQSETKILIISAIFVEFVALVHLRRLAASSKSRSTENVSFLMILEICRMVNGSYFCEKLKIFDFLWKTSKIMFDLYSIELKNHQTSSIWSLFVDLKIIQ